MKKRTRRRPPTPLRDYPPGFFTELIYKENWPPMFTPASVERARDPVTMAIAAQAAGRQRGKGWEAQPLNLPGAAPYVESPLRPGR